MSIHPASASEPAMRETDSKPSPRDWSLLQGSRAGSKEGQFSSFWDNAVRGAQKLFGLERAEKEVEPEEERSEDSKREEPKLGNGLNAVAGFGGSRFGMSLSMGREFGGGLPNFGRIEPSTPEPTRIEAPPREKKPVAPSANASDRAKERAPLRGESDSRAEDAKARRASDELPDEENEKQAKSAERSRRGTATPLSNLPERFLRSDNQEVANGRKPVGIETAQNAVTMRKASSEQVKSAPAPQEGLVVAQSTAREAAPKTANAQPIQPQSIQNESVATATKAAQTTPASQAEAPALQSPKPQNVTTPVVSPSETVNRTGESQAESKPPHGPLQATERRIATDVQRQTAPELARPTEGKPTGDLAAKSEAAAKQPAAESTLAIDPDKAKAELSAALQRQSRPAATRPAPAPSHTQTQAQAPVESNPEQSAKLSDTAKATTPEPTNRIPEQKPAQSQDLASRMVENARGRRSDGVHPNAENNRPQTAPNANQNATENAASQSRVANPDKLEGFAANLRSVTRPEVPQRGPSSRAQGNSVNAVSQGMGSLSGATNGVGQSAGSQSQSQQQGFDQAPKQDFAAAVKSAATSVRNDKVDTGQSFHVEGPNATQSRRSEAATRMQQTSYVSKSPQEVKEVIATLTKSIDRLAAIKQDSVSVRVNFEQGGTLSLKVSIENGRVTAAMQTDLPGLEGMLKGSWNELVNEVAQKGLKLNAPQFTQSEGEQRNENFASQEQREGRSQSSGAENGRGERRNQSADTNGERGRGHRPQQGDAMPEETVVGQDAPSVSSNELKTYA